MVNNLPMEDQYEKDIEDGFADLMVALFKLRQTKQYQREYDTLGTVIGILSENRQFLRQNFDIKI